ncbi:FGGY-family carbohydrate kinase [Prauserella cavernicola]|uniref:FGGY-family carbohydrate kinase n=1 Tax=Prauserella cavernicola TaxID=2800127 RepID=A0A934QQB5_9PSEU|nr:FGGY-family carbohydrate kinase [Prauserella cavernicola]MBK1783533.1 FGGY-family carbohydrate kinase [Prauserella cavernicola]
MTRTNSLVLGIDVGTSSTKGVLVERESGTVVATAVRAHDVSRPRPGHVEMDARVWWAEFRDITAELLGLDAGRVEAVGVSGMGPCVVLTGDEEPGTEEPLRPAILYGVDTRATEQIARLGEELGAEAVLDRCGSLLSTQAIGPKLAWVAEREPEVAATARRLYLTSSWLASRLTGEYVLDHHSASQAVPLYDSRALEWYAPWARHVAPWLELPPLRWPGDIAGHVTARAAAETGLAQGLPVITGTVDAWSEAVSVGAQRPGDLMIMYGTTMFLIATTRQRLTVPNLWGTLGAYPDTRSLAGGMATSGAVTEWLRGIVGEPEHGELLAEAERSGPGARGLLMLPYFAGERTPIADPDARGVIAGLTLAHTRGDLHRAALEATAHGVRHNITALREAGADLDRIIAVGGGTQGGLWTRIVSDITGMAQQIPSVTLGASYGAALLAAQAIGDADAETWNPVREVHEPDPALAEHYDRLHRLYLDLYPATRPVVHELASWGNERG